MKKAIFLIGLIFLFTLIVGAAPGDLDSSFDMDGKVVTEVSSGLDGGRAVCIDSTNRIIVAGDAFNGSNQDFAVTRYNENGSLDTSFGTNGIVLTDFSSGEDFARAVVMDSNGKIIVAGLSGNDFAVVRYNSDGSLDTSFDTDGKITTSFGSTGSIANALTIDTQGKIIVAGTSFNGATDDFALVRYNSNGSLDTSFDTDGLVTTDVGSNKDDFASAVAIDSQGKIVVAGNQIVDGSESDFAVARYNTNGSLDTSFNTDGLVTTDFGSTDEIGNAIAIDSTDKVIVGGYKAASSNSDDGDFALAKYNTDGSLDTSFDTDGIVTSDFNSTFDTVFSLAIDSHSKIVAAGFVSDKNFASDFALARYEANGSLDISFNSDGKVTTDFGSVGDVGYGLAFDSSNKIIVVGQSEAIGSSTVKSSFGGEAPTNFAVARYQSAGTTTLNKPIFDFDGDSKTDISIFRPNVGEWWYLRSSDLGNRALQFGNSTDIPVPADFTGDGKTDITFWRNGEWFVLRSEDDSFFSFPFGTTGDIPAPGDFDGDGKADPTVFRPSQGVWFVSKTTGGTDIIPFGIAEDKPVVADYDGDGKDDIGIFRPSVSQWWINRSTDGLAVVQFGQNGDKTVQGDYTGDGKADIAFFRSTSGEWFIVRSEDSSFFSFPFGTNGDIAAPGDYDGDGTFDSAVFRPSQTTWFLNTTSNGVQIVGFGANGDVPIPSVFSRP